MDMDILICIDILGVKPEQINLSQSVPPHSIISWEGGDPQPTQEELESAWQIYLSTEPMRLLRIERDRLLEESDWIVNRSYSQGVSVPTEWAEYLQQLRDLPTTATPTLDPSTSTGISGVTWPIKPSA